MPAPLSDAVRDEARSVWQAVTHVRQAQQVRFMPGMRSSLMKGIEGGTVVGMLALIKTRSAARAGHVGAASFALISSVNWELFNYERRKSRAILDELRQTIAQKKRSDKPPSEPLAGAHLRPSFSLAQLAGARFIHTHVAAPMPAAAWRPSESTPLFAAIARAASAAEAAAFPAAGGTAASPAAPAVVATPAGLREAARRGDVDAALRMLAPLEESGEADLRVYTSLAMAAFRARRGDVVDAVLARMDARNLRRDQFLFEALGRFYATTDRWQDAVALLRRAAATGEHRASVSVVNCALAGAPDASKLALFDELRALGAPLDYHSVNIVMAALVRQDRIDEAAALAESAPCALATVNYNTLLLALARAGRADAVADAYGRMRARGLLPDHVTFNAVVSAAARCRAGAAALHGVLRDISSGEARVTPDRFTYPLLLKLCAREGDAAAAVALMEEYCARYAGAEAERPSAASTLSWHRPPSAPTSALFAQALAACASPSAQDAAHRLLDLMRAHAVPMDRAVLRALLRATRDYARVAEAASDLLAGDGAPLALDSDTLCGLYDRLRVDATARKADLLNLERVRRASRTPLTAPAARAFLRAFSRHCADGTDMQAALAVCDELRAAGIAPSPAELLPLVDMAGRSRNRLAVDAVWRAVTAAAAQQPLSRAAHHTHLMALARCRDVAAVDAHLAAMRADPLGPTPVTATYALMLQAAVGDADTALRIYAAWQRDTGGFERRVAGDDERRFAAEEATAPLASRAARVVTSRVAAPPAADTAKSPSAERFPTLSTADTPKHPASLLVQCLVHAGLLEDAVEFVESAFLTDPAWFSSAPLAHRAVAAYCGNYVVRALCRGPQDHPAARRRLGLAVRTLRTHQAHGMPVYRTTLAAVADVTGEPNMTLPKQLGALGAHLFHSRPLARAAVH